jgi:hypothetical protein
MPRKRTRTELEHEIETLRAYQELCFALLRDKSCANRVRTVYGPRELKSGEHRFWLYGVDRASGGVVVSEDHSVLGLAVDVCIRWNASGDPYLRDCASQVHRAQKEYLERRSA